MSRGCRAWICGAAVWLAGSGPRAVAAEPTAEGLYAWFTTSLGEFWCRLELEKAPRTVAHFVGLAEGTHPWMDFQQPGLRQRPFYDGITFHRIIPGFMNQAGSRNDRGTDGPGYQFADEFHPTLRHDRPGILSMANSGPHSNGGQLFITVAPPPWLDDRHAVFGAVVSGYAVVTNLNLRAGTPSGTPRQTVILQSVRILRQGAAAQAFDPGAVAPPLSLRGRRSPAGCRLLAASCCWITRCAPRGVTTCSWGLTSYSGSSSCSRTRSSRRWTRPRCGDETDSFSSCWPWAPSRERPVRSRFA